VVCNKQHSTCVRCSVGGAEHLFLVALENLAEGSYGTVHSSSKSILVHEHRAFSRRERSCVGLY